MMTRFLGFLLVIMMVLTFVSCSLEVATDPCTPGETKCGNDNLFLKCRADGRTWDEIICGIGEHLEAFCHVEHICVACNEDKTCQSSEKHCVNHACEPLSVKGCTEGTTKCEHETVQFCRKKAWETGALCPDGCNAEGTACKTASEACEQGSTRCIGGKILSCLEDGNWNTGVACQEGQECVQGGNACTDIVEKICIEHATQCSGTGELMSCHENAWVNSACDDGQICPIGKTACEALGERMGMRLDGGLASGTSTFDGKVFAPLLPYLTDGEAHDSNEGITAKYEIAGTDFDALYQNETWGQLSKQATFTIPIDNGDYTVHLHFVDWVHSTAGQRQFHVDLQGTRVLSDFDIIKEAGKSTALVKSFDVTVTDGTVLLTITAKISESEIAAIEILPKGESHLPLTDIAINRDPTVGAGADQSITLPTNSVTLSAIGKDVDGDTLSYSWTKTSGGAVSIVTPTAASTQIFGLIAGSYTFGVTVDDGHGGTASDTVIITVKAAVVVGPAFYVSPTGLDSNAGTSKAAPFKTLEKARDAAQASTTVKTVYLLGGVYSRAATLYLGEADAGQSWLAYPGETPILDGGNSTKTAITIWANDITIRWITFRNFVNYTINADAFSEDILITSLVIDSNTVLNTLSDAFNQAAIFIGGTVTNARITHNLVDGANYIGIAGISGFEHDISNLMISHNVVYNSCRTVGDCGGIYVIDRKHTSTKITIDNNIVGNYGLVPAPLSYEAQRDMATKGIYLDDWVSNVTVKNNIVYGLGTWAFQYHGGDHNILTNNIFDFSGATLLGLYQDVGTPNYGMGSNAFTCNIVYSSAAPPASLWDLYDGVPITKPTVSNNLYWGANGALHNSGKIVDSNPHVADPGFVDPAAHNYSFSGSNPATFCGFKPIDVSQVGPLPNL